MFRDLDRAKRALAGPFAPGLEVTPSLFAVSHDAKLVFSGGHWDNSVRVYSVNKQKMVAHIVRHTGQRSTLTVSVLQLSLMVVGNGVTNRCILFHHLMLCFIMSCPVNFVILTEVCSL